MVQSLLRFTRESLTKTLRHTHTLIFTRVHLPISSDETIESS